MFNKIIRFFEEAYNELRLANWLTRQQMAASTLVVVILTLLVAAYVALVDRILLIFANILFRMG